MPKLRIPLKSLRASALWRLACEFAPFRGKVAFVLALGIVISAIQPLAVKLSQRILDELQHGMTSEFFKWAPFGLVLIFMVSGLSKYFYNTERRFLAERIIIKFRTALFEKYLMLPLAVLDSKRTGDMLSSIQNDLALINQGLDTLCDVLKEPFTFIGLIGVAFYCDWKLTLWTMFVAPMVAFLFSRSGAAVKRYSARNIDQFSDLVSLSQESLTGSRIVKVFRLEGTLIEKFRYIHDQYFKTVIKSIRIQELPTPLVELIGSLLMAGVVVYGHHQIVEGQLTAGKLVAFLLALGLAQMPLKQLNGAFLKLKVSEAAAERVYQLLDTPHHEERNIANGGNARVLSFRKDIVFDSVDLAYGDKRALENISFEVKRGDCVAFVGLSGSGKTSIVNLLPRLYDVTRGRILLDGVDVRDITLSDLRGLISFVTQDTFLFNDSLYENIRYGRPSASQREIERAAEQAHCLDFIRKCPQGFDTRVGDRGVCLSGGERQRIAIARALLKGAPILVLDEATSSLDSQSEMMVQTALEELMEGRTTLLVAHRFSTVRRANRIYVLEGGRIREWGTHEELVGRRGIYNGLFERQATGLQIN